MLDMFDSKKNQILCSLWHKKPKYSSNIFTVASSFVNWKCSHNSLSSTIHDKIYVLITYFNMQYSTLGWYMTEMLQYDDIDWLYHWIVLLTMPKYFQRIHRNHLEATNIRHFDTSSRTLLWFHPTVETHSVLSIVIR